MAALDAETNTAANAAKTKRKGSGSRSGAAASRSKPRKSGSSREHQSAQRSESLSTLIWVVPLVSIILMFWVLVLNMGYIDSEQYFGFGTDLWNLLSIFIILCLFILLALIGMGSLMGEAAPSPSTSRAAKNKKGVVVEAIPDEAESSVSTKKPDEAVEVKTEGSAEEVTEIVETTEKEAGETKDRAVKAEAGTPSVSELEPDMVEYPPRVGSGLYGDTYIQIDKDRMLKLRTLLIEDYYLIQ